MTTPSVGQWVWGDRMNPCQVVDIGTKRSTGQTMLRVLCLQGARVVPLESVKGVASTKPNLLVMPRPIQVGDRVRLKNTTLTYNIIEIYKVRDGLENGEPTFEAWAKLQTDDGKPDLEAIGIVVDGSDGSDDIFAQVSADTIQKGSTVGKAHNLGWLGWVQSDPIDGRVDVLWQFDKHPTLEKLTDLKIKEHHEHRSAVRKAC